ncbi:MAG: OmpH family outer membrane protein [Rikenellaceae bacterium]
MKNVIKAAAVVAFALSVTTTFAQKMGRIQVQEIVMAMPETATMQTNLEAFSKDLSDNLETMQVEFNNKLADYQSNLKNYTESVRNLKEKELQDLQTRMQQFEQSARQEIQNKQSELLNPIITKARDAISKVAAEGGYDVVYDESAGSLAYVNNATVVDISPKVKTALGIK